ncbi:hypothetical protein [Actinoallomurus sp. CA-142502]|uniref:hypothetical protein n=1 Tax=Actinoallomurus sp. CA-142502 TaxID=3239885 RepID=UPI003D89B236
MKHYSEAERLADQANHWTYGDGNDPTVGAALAAEAQARGLLALADALALLRPLTAVGGETPSGASRYDAEFDRLADRWRAIEDEHDQIHPDRDDCGGVGACVMMRAAHDLETRMQDALESWRRGADGDEEDSVGEARCRVCGCTENNACVGGCHWIPDPLMGDLCSRCGFVNVIAQLNAGEIKLDDAMTAIRQRLMGQEDDGETDSDAMTYPAPGSDIPDQPGYVVGTCGHRVAASEWRAGYRVCERCPHPDTTGAHVTAPDDVDPAEAADLIRQAVEYLRGPIADQAERRHRLAAAAGPLAALLDEAARHWDAVRIAGATPPGAEAVAVARKLTGGAW